MLETSHPPTYYLPAEAFEDGVLRPVAGTHLLRVEGQAAYFDLVTPDRIAARARLDLPDAHARVRAARRATSR